MRTVKGRPLDLKSVKRAWQGLNRLVPLVPIASEKDWRRRIRGVDDLLGLIGAEILPRRDCHACLLQYVQGELSAI